MKLKAAVIVLFSFLSFEAMSKEFKTLSIQFYGYPTIGEASSRVEVCDNEESICKNLSSQDGVYAHSIEYMKIEESIDDILSNSTINQSEFKIRVISEFKTLGTSNLSTIISEFKVLLSNDKKIQVIRVEHIYEYGSTYQEIPLSSSGRFVQAQLQTKSDSYGKFLGTIPNFEPVTLISIF